MLNPGKIEEGWQVWDTILGTQMGGRRLYFPEKSTALKKSKLL